MNFIYKETMEEDLSSYIKDFSENKIIKINTSSKEISKFKIFDNCSGLLNLPDGYLACFSISKNDLSIEQLFELIGHIYLYLYGNEVGIISSDFFNNCDWNLVKINNKQSCIFKYSEVDNNYNLVLYIPEYLENTYGILNYKKIQSRITGALLDAEIY